VLTFAQHRKSNGKKADHRRISESPSALKVAARVLVLRGSTNIFSRAFRKRKGLVISAPMAIGQAGDRRISRQICPKQVTPERVPRSRTPPRKLRKKRGAPQLRPLQPRASDLSPLTLPALQLPISPFTVPELTISSPGEPKEPKVLDEPPDEVYTWPWDMPRPLRSHPVNHNKPLARESTWTSEQVVTKALRRGHLPLTRVEPKLSPRLFSPEMLARSPSVISQHATAVKFRKVAATKIDITGQLGAVATGETYGTVTIENVDFQLVRPVKR